MKIQFLAVLRSETDKSCQSHAWVFPSAEPNPEPGDSGKTPPLPEVLIVADRYIRTWPNHTMIQADPDSVARCQMDELCSIRTRITRFSEFQHLQFQSTLRYPKGLMVLSVRNNGELDRSNVTSTQTHGLFLAQSPRKLVAMAV